MNQTFDLSRCPKNDQGHLLCRTRDGRKARIVCTDKRSPFPIVAIYEGKCGQDEGFDSFCLNGKLHDDSEPSSGDLINFPEPPKYRAWKPEEVPLGCWIRSKKRDAQFNRYVLLGVNGSDIAYGRAGYVSLTEALSDKEHSTDGGKTWNECGVLES
jgi:hypothetical protein